MLILQGIFCGTGARGGKNLPRGQFSFGKFNHEKQMPGAKARHLHQP
jgi:hypothetical protein